MQKCRYGDIIMVSSPCHLCIVQEIFGHDQSNPSVSKPNWIDVVIFQSLVNNLICIPQIL